MSDETLQLLKAFIDAAGYEVETKPVAVKNGIYEIGIPEYIVTKKKPKPRAQAKSEGYDANFERLWDLYPKDNKGSKKAAYRKYQGIVGMDKGEISPGFHAKIHKAVVKYKAYVEATNRWVMQFSKFIGPDEYYLNDWIIPESAKRQNRVRQDWEKIPENDNHLAGFIQKYGFKQGHDRMDKVFDTRKKLQAQIKQRIEDETRT